MDMDMMMQYHQELYRLHSCLANQHYQVSQTQMQIASLNRQMHMHMHMKDHFFTNKSVKDILWLSVIVHI